MNRPAPSAAQLDAIQKLSENGGTLERWPGAYWTFPGCPCTAAPHRPDWHISAETMREMESRGWLRPALRWREDWRDDRELTTDGRALCRSHHGKEQEHQKHGTDEAVAASARCGCGNDNAG